MKTMHATLCAAAALALAAAPASAASRSGDGHPFGLGIMLGSPTGLTGKLYLGGKPFALQMGIGAVEDLNNDDFDDDGWQVHVDVVWHPAVLARQPAFTLPFYVGVGGRIAEDDDYYRINGTTYVDEDTFLGVRVPFGLLMAFNRVPLDIFFELALVVDVVEFEDSFEPYDDDPPNVGFNGGVGLRYYF